MNYILARLIRKQIYFILILLLSFSLISCGNKGPLTVPESYNDAKLKTLRLERNAIGYHGNIFNIQITSFFHYI